MRRLEGLGSLAWPAVFLVLCSWNALLAVFLGKEMNWDLLNYHFYNGYAFLTGRLGIDMAPAQVQTFLNPLLDVPLYLAIRTLPPVLVGAAYGFAQGLNGCAVWLIGREMIPAESPAVRDWASFALALLSGLGAINVGELGGSMGDTLVSIPILFSVALLLRKQRELQVGSRAVVMRWAGLAGAISGVAAGLKMSAAFYPAGLAIGCLFLVRVLARRLLVTAAFGVGAVAGWLLLGGFWLWEMWSRFGNPFFPFLQSISTLARSEFAGVVAVRDTRFLPTSVASAAIYPLVWAINPMRVAEAPFRDWRFPILYLCLIALAAWWCIGRAGQLRRPFQVPAGNAAFLLVGCLASYILWLLTFGVYRYLAPLEWLVPIAVVLTLWTLLPTRYRTNGIVAVLVLTTVTTWPANWGRAGWTESYFGVETPRMERGPERMVLIAGLNALSFLIPHFPPDVRFIRLQSNSYLYGMALGGFYGEGWTLNQFDKQVQAAMASHKGDLYVLFDGSYTSPVHPLAGAHELDAVLLKLRLRVRTESCQPVRMAATPPPPWAIFRRAYEQPLPLLMPSVTLCQVARIPPAG